MNQNASPKFEILSLFEKGQSERLLKLDKLLLAALTLIYAVIALLNLGTLSFPTSVYEGAVGDSFTLDLGETVAVDEVWFNSNIAQGTLRFIADDGAEETYTQDQGDMFKWHEVSMSFTTRYITVYVEDRAVAVNEIAFFRDGERLPVTVVSENGRAVADEQDTVPETPSYFNGMIFDEIYHARTAYENIHNMSVYEWTHPPLGKLIIYRYGRYEIDIVARERRSGILVFVEVKTRSNTAFGLPRDAVTAQKQLFLTRAAQGYLKQHRIPDAHTRFDVVEVYTNPLRIIHLPGAF